MYLGLVGFRFAVEGIFAALWKAFPGARTLQAVFDASRSLGSFRSTATQPLKRSAWP